MRYPIAVIAALGLSWGNVALADWFEDFDSYVNGSGISGQGGWRCWDGAACDATVTNAQSLSAPHSLGISGGADMIQEFSGLTSGLWTCTAWQYIPSSSTGQQYFVMLNNYADGGPYNWSTQVSFNMNTGIVQSESTAVGQGPTAPMVKDQWVEFRVEIDLNNNVQFIYYNGSQLDSFSWNPGVTIGGQGPPLTNIAVIDLFANGADPVYYDDLSLVLVPPTLALVADDDCYEGGVGDTVVVAVELSDGVDEIVGGQFFLEYDNTVLDFVSADPGDNPFTQEIFESVDEIAGAIDYAVGIPPGPWPFDDRNMAYFTFDALAEVCDVLDLVTFRANDPPTRLTDAQGIEIPSTLVDLGPVTIDGTPPVITCPVDVTYECDEWEEFFDKMHFPQWPDETGWDVLASGFVPPFKVLADDWLCTETGLVQDIHFWGSWEGGVEGQILFFVLSIHDDIPVNPEEGIFYSRPGAERWRFEAFDFGFVPIDPPTMQGWYDPNTGEFMENDHQNYFRYDVLLPEPWWFPQEAGTIYWLNVTAVLAFPGPRWGWKTSFLHFNDDAVWGDTDDPFMPPSEWFELRDPITFESLDMAFVITQGPGGPPDSGTATATDNCTPPLTIDIAFQDVVTPGGCPWTFTVNRTWTATDFCGNQDSCTQVISVVDTTPPVIICPSDITVNADAGGCTANVMVGFPLVADNCDPAPAVVGARSDGMALGAPYPVGATLITWTATDCSGNPNVCFQTITVNAFNELVVDVELSPTMDPGPLERCITFVVSGNDPTQTVSEVLTFNNGLASSVTVLVPCGDYDCIEARDVLHTTQRAQTLGLSGTQYTADFTVDPDSGGDWLVGGNLNDDVFVDILDFGVFIGELNTNYGTGDTTCSTPFPHADVNGDAVVDTIDYLFISLNFLARSEVGCPAWPDIDRPAIGVAGPVTRISVKTLERRGLGHLAIADLNRDGWLDTADMRAFANGARP